MLFFFSFFYDYFWKTLSGMEVRLNMFSNWGFFEAWNELKSVYPNFSIFGVTFLILKRHVLLTRWTILDGPIVYKSSRRFNSKWLWTNQKRNENCFHTILYGNKIKKTEEEKEKQLSWKKNNITATITLTSGGWSYHFRHSGLVYIIWHYQLKILFHFFLVLTKTKPHFCNISRHVAWLLTFTYIQSEHFI